MLGGTQSGTLYLLNIIRNGMDRIPNIFRNSAVSLKKGFIAMKRFFSPKERFLYPTVRLRISFVLFCKFGTNVVHDNSQFRYAQINKTSRLQNQIIDSCYLVKSFDSTEWLCIYRFLYDDRAIVLCLGTPCMITKLCVVFTHMHMVSRLNEL